MKNTILFLLLLTGAGIATAQSPKREMRAAWMATVWRLDWPKETDTSKQQEEMITLLDTLATNNMNAVFFQVRGFCDAMYDSPYEPWSHNLTGTRGTAPGQGFDPLQYIVEEGHKRGIEVYAWVNPFRFEGAASGPTNFKGKAGDYREILPDGCVLFYPNGKSILNPGRPEVRERIKLIVGDIVCRYDVDGIIFDDYFYENDTKTLDQTTFEVPLYNPEGLTDINEWRRQNVNKMIAEVYDTIQQLKPYVRFGVGPFGFWTTSTVAAAANGLALPIGITGNTAYYANKGCDPVAWLSQGIIDYISPQLYWPTSQWPILATSQVSGYSPGQAYESLCPWWSDVANRFSKHFYSSQIGNSDPRYLNREELGRQIEINRNETLNGAPGSVLYGTKSMINRTALPVAFQQLYLQHFGSSTVTDFFPYFKKNYFTEKALPPAIDWKTQDHYTATIRGTRTDTVVDWEAYSDVPGGARYTVYAVPDAEVGEAEAYSTSRHLLGISYTNSFALPSPDYDNGYTFVIGILDRYGNEFIDGQKMLGAAPPTPMKITSPANEHIYPGSTSSVTVAWDIRLAATGFTVEQSLNPDFTDATTKNVGPHTVQFQKTQQTTYTGLANGTYYVRVKADYGSTYSSAWSDAVQFTIGTPAGISLINEDLFDCFAYQDGAGAYLKITCKTATPLNASLIDLSGRIQFKLIANETMSAGEHTIPLPAGLSKGVYVIRIDSPFGNRVVKIII